MAFAHPIPKAQSDSQVVGEKTKVKKAPGEPLVGMFTFEHTHKHPKPPKEGERESFGRSHVAWPVRKFVDLHEAKICIADQIVVYGHGIFEGINFYKGKDGKAKILFLKEHLDRMEKGMKESGLEPPLSREQMERFIIETVERSGMEEGYIRPVITAGVGKGGALGIGIKRENPTFFVYVCHPIALFDDDQYANGISVKVSPYMKMPQEVINLISKKWTDYFLNIMVKEDAKKSGYGDGIMNTYIRKGRKGEYVSELSAMNVFFLGKDGVLYTPSLESNCLDGVTRRAIMKLAKEMGIDVVEKRCTVEHLRKAGEVFGTGTAAGIIAITRVGKTKIGDGKEGSVTKALRRAYKEKVIPENLTPLVELPKFEDLKEGEDYVLLKDERDDSPPFLALAPAQ